MRVVAAKGAIKLLGVHTNMDSLYTKASGEATSNKNCGASGVNLVVARELGQNAFFDFSFIVFLKFGFSLNLLVPEQISRIADAFFSIFFLSLAAIEGQIIRSYLLIIHKQRDLQILSINEKNMLNFMNSRSTGPKPPS